SSTSSILGCGSGGCATASVPVSVLVTADSHRHRDQVALHDLGLELVAEKRERRIDRCVCRGTDETDRCHLERERRGVDAEAFAGRVREFAWADRLTDLEQ